MVFHYNTPADARSGRSLFLVKEIFFMKKSVLCLVMGALLVSAPALYAAEHDFNIRLGALVPVDDTNNSPRRVSFDGVFGFNIGIVKYFAIGFETGLNWIQWKSYTGSELHSGNLTALQTKTINGYTLPFLVNMMVRFDHRDEWKVMPYIAPGIGYGVTFFMHPDSREIYHGFTWQVLAGLAIRAGDVTTMDIMLEAGYRGAYYANKDDYELNMSGLVFHAGVRFPLGGGDSW